MLGIIITIKKYTKRGECEIQECGVCNLNKLASEVLTEKEKAWF